MSDRGTTFVFLLLASVLVPARTPAWEGSEGTLAAVIWGKLDGGGLESVRKEYRLLSYSEDLAVILLPPGSPIPSGLEGVLLPLEPLDRGKGRYYLYLVQDASKAAFTGDTRVLLRQGRTVVLRSGEDPPRLAPESRLGLSGFKQPVRISVSPKAWPPAGAFTAGVLHPASQPALVPTEFDPVVGVIVADVNEGEYVATWQVLDDFETRYFDTPQNEAAAQWIHDVLGSYGLDVEFHLYNHQGQRRNVVGTLPGLVEPEKVVYMTAHFDSIIWQGSGNPRTTAPGADDNASGTAAVLEAARVMSRYRFHHTIRFVAFNSEEQGLIGSDAYVEQIASEGEDVIGCFDYDMIAYRGNDPDPPDLVIYADPGSLPIARMLEDACHAYVPAEVEPKVVAQFVAGSDHAPFVNHGYMGIWAVEAEAWGEDFCPWYHTPDDRIENYPTDYPTHVTMAAVAALAQAAIPMPYSDCNGNEILDVVELADGASPDCNGNWVPDDCDVASGTSPDCNSNGIPDGCDLRPSLVLGDPGGVPVLHVPLSVTAGDLDGDGDIDVATGSNRSEEISILLNRGGGEFEDAVASEPGRRCVFITAADLDGDGTMDLVTANASSNSVSIFSSDDRGTFEEVLEYASGDVPYHVETIDADGDGDLDLAVSHRGSDRLTVLRNSRGRSFSRLADVAVGSAPLCSAAVDLDGDGDPDLAVANNVSSTVSLVLNEGGGSFAAGDELTVGARPACVVARDLDNDGDVDLATVSPPSSTVSVLMNAGDGTFAEAVDLAVKTGSESLAAWDVDGDGSVDLVTSGRNRNRVSVYLNLGDGTFREAFELATGRGLEPVVPADLDGDGRLDLVAASVVSEQVLVAMNLTAPARSGDCDRNGIADECDISGGRLTDTNGNGTADECEVWFVRGDVDLSGRLSIADVVLVCTEVFGIWSGPCADAADCDDDGSRTLADPVLLLRTLFRRGPGVHQPFPFCGVDPTEDGLSCESFALCE